MTRFASLFVSVIFAVAACLLLNTNIMRAADPKPLPIKEPSADTTITFDQVAKILKKNCIACHSGSKAEASLVLDTPASIAKGGDSGAGLVKNSSAESLIFRSAAHLAEPIMPPLNNKANAVNLLPDELGILKAWIDQGAAEGSPKPTNTIRFKPLPKRIAAIYSSAMSPDGSIAAVGYGNQLVLVDTAKGNEIARLSDPSLSQNESTSNKGDSNKSENIAHPDTIYSLAFAPSGKLLASGAFREIKLWRCQKTSENVDQWKLERTIGDINNPEQIANRVLGLDFSTDGKQLVSGGGEPTRSGEVKVWNVVDGTLIRDINDPHSDTSFCVRFSPDDELIASAGADRMVKIFKTSDGSPVRTFEGHGQHVLCLAWKRDGKSLISGGADSLLKVWDIKSGEQRRTITGYTKEIPSLSFLGESSRIVVASAANVARITNIDGGNVERTFSGLSGFVYSVSASRDGKIFVASGEDGRVLIFDPAKSEPLKIVNLNPK